MALLNKVSQLLGLGSFINSRWDGSTDITNEPCECPQINFRSWSFKVTGNISKESRRIMNILKITDMFS
jgi:hypothetical protein